GAKLLKKGLIKPEGRTTRRLYALPEQKIDADAVLPAPTGWKKKPKGKSAKKKARRAYPKRVKGIARAALKLDAKVRARETADRLNASLETDPLAGAISNSFARLRVAFDQHLVAVTSA